ncbi:cytochrome P450 Tp4149-like [Bidens hawaiensis]|uniref:cytochrome P450 Tp4149-like n=1 Tax=Bidens hawaiensis TaxID=980011 RepID=UPI0040495152
MLLHLGSIPTLVASSAEAAREIMKTHDLTFGSRPNLTITAILFHGNRDIAFAPSGEYWRQLKTVAKVHLLGHAKVKSYRKIREEELGSMISKLGGSDGTTVDVGSLFVTYINNIVCRVTIGKTYENGLKRKNLLKRFIDAFAGFSVGSYIPWLSWVDQLIGSVENAKRVSKELVDEFLEDVIQEHVAKRKAGGAKDDKGQDFIDILLDVQKQSTAGFTLDRDAIKGVLLDAFGGTESTYASLEWAMSELVRNPGIMKKLQQEATEVAHERSIISEDDLKNMLYLKAVINESFRLHTPVPLLVPRETLQDVKLMGYDVPSRTQVLVNAWAIAKDPAIWDNPTEFRPERFLKSSVNYQGSHFELTPYGAGQRICSGMDFSIAIIELALANLVYKFDFTLPNGMKNEDLDMSEAYGVSVHRKSPLLVRVSPRF